MHIDGEAPGWTLLIGAASAMLLGLVPGLRLAAGSLLEALKDSGAGSWQSRKHERLRAMLVVSAVALAYVLLVGAGLLLRSFLKVLDIDLGLQPERAAAVTEDYKDDPARRFRDICRRSGLHASVLWLRYGRNDGIDSWQIAAPAFRVRGST